MAGEEYPLPSLPDPGPIITNPNIQPPRPANSWILYRRWKVKQLPPAAPGEARRNQSDMSAVLAVCWRGETQNIRDHFDRLAEEAKAQHKARYPNYRYQPKKKEDPKPPVPRKIKSDRSVSAQSNPGSSKVDRPGHPYPSSARPSRLPPDPFPPSPPLSAASSPGASSVYDIQPSPSSVAVHDASSPESSRSALLATSSQPPVEDGVTTTSTLDSMAQSQNAPLQLPESHHPDNFIDGSWNLSLFQGDSWASIPYMNENLGDQSTAFTFDLPQGTLPADNILPCGHPEDGPHAAACFLETADVEATATIPSETQSEIEISLGTLHGTYTDFGVESNDYALHNSVLAVPDMSLYSQDMSAYNLPPDYFPFVTGSISNDNIEDTTGLFSFSNDGDMFYPQVQENQDTSSQHPDTSSYVPPSGASHSSTRRVGGDWSGYVRDDVYAASPFEVEAS